MPDVSVITTVHGRLDHLHEMRRGLRRQQVDAEHVVVRMGGPEPWAATEGSPQVVPVELSLPTAADDSVDTPAWLPLAAARNAGAAAAGSDLLVFLDVDCIPSSDLLGRYLAASRTHRGLLCGPVGYLPEGFAASSADDAGLAAAAAPHPARPDPPVGHLVDEQRYELFWSLSFAIRRADFDALGGFHEGYIGYGGEDTDLAFQARSQGVSFTWVGGASAWHQHHPTQDPPRQHLESIVRNATVFHARWGSWPMQGWLRAFADEGLVDWDVEGGQLRRTSGAQPPDTVAATAQLGTGMLPRGGAPAQRGAPDVRLREV